MKTSQSLLPILNQTLHSLTGAENLTARCVRPDRYRDLKNLMKTDQPVIARGAGLSYCLASASEAGLSIDMKEFNRILEFNTEQQYVLAEAGLTIGELIIFLHERGYWFSVLPGYPKITLGGCLAFNVHGKSQYHHGIFSDHVMSFSLLAARGEEVEVLSQSDLFYLTAGGMGLTGVITKIKLKIQKIEAKSILRQRFDIGHLLEAPELLNKYKNQGDQMYSWHNLNLLPKKFGQGFLYLESFSDDRVEGNFEMGRLDLNRKLGFVDTILGPLMTRFINPAYSFLEKIKGPNNKMDLLNAAFPLNQKEIYFRACRAQTFFEYQCIVPFSSWQQFIEGFIELKIKWAIRTSLGSLKLFKGTEKLLHFQKEGICFTADILNSANCPSFLTYCDELLLKCGALPNIAKDSRLSAKIIKRSYPGYKEFQTGIQKLDPEKRMSSVLRERIGV